LCKEGRGRVVQSALTDRLRGLLIMWGAVIIVAPPPDILDVREQVIEGEGAARALYRLYVLL
jgi:hypothetical protein